MPGKHYSKEEQFKRVRAVQDRMESTGETARQAIIAECRFTGIGYNTLTRWYEALTGTAAVKKRGPRTVTPKAVPLGVVPDQHRTKLLAALIAAIGDDKFDNWLADRIIESLIK